MPKKLNLDLEGQDGNVFALLGYFKREAKKAGWTESEIKAKTAEAMNGNYYHLLAALMDA